MKPTIGRIVHYRKVGQRPQAAIITDVRLSGADVDLTVFPSDGPPYGRKTVRHSSPGSETNEGCWCWPPHEGD